jgi:hypothetical protein
VDFLPALSRCLLQVACVGCLRMVWWTSGVAAVGASPSGGATTGLAARWWWYSHYGSAPSPSALGGLLDLSKRVNGSGCLNLSVACVYSAGHGWLAALSWATCTGLAACCCFLSHQSKGCSCGRRPCGVQRRLLGGTPGRLVAWAVAGAGC